MAADEEATPRSATGSDTTAALELLVLASGNIREVTTHVAKSMTKPVISAPQGKIGVLSRELMRIETGKIVRDRQLSQANAETGKGWTQSMEKFRLYFKGDDGKRTVPSRRNLDKVRSFARKESWMAQELDQVSDNRTRHQAKGFHRFVDLDGSEMGRRWARLWWKVWR